MRGRKNEDFDGGGIKEKLFEGVKKKEEKNNVKQSHGITFLTHSTHSLPLILLSSLSCHFNHRNNISEKKERS